MIPRALGLGGCVRREAAGLGQGDEPVVLRSHHTRKTSEGFRDSVPKTTGQRKLQEHPSAVPRRPDAAA